MAGLSHSPDHSSSQRLTTRPHVQLNLPPGALQVASIALVLVSPFAKFALTMEPVAQGVDASLGLQRAGPMAGVQRRGVRTGLSVFALFLATKVPFFGVFMSILGAFLTLTVSVLFPCMAHLKLDWDELSPQRKAVDFVILGVGLFATVAGTSTAVHSLPQGAVGDLDAIAHTATSAVGLGNGVFKTLVCESLCFTQ